MENCGNINKKGVACRGYRSNFIACTGAALRNAGYDPWTVGGGLVSLSRGCPGEFFNNGSKMF